MPPFINNIKFLCITYIIGFLSMGLAMGQEQKRTMLDSLNFYGKISAQAAFFNENMALQENAPRIGIHIQRKMEKGFSISAQLEYGYHLIDGTQFNNDANSTIEFSNNPFKKKDAFSSRLAIAKIQHAKWGAFSLGKQWGVYSEIANYTDNFTVFGGESNGVYSGNTDGGWKGTGRADNSFIYRNSFRSLSLGVQTQLFKNNTTTFGAALEYKFKFGLSLGTAYNIAQINEKYLDFISTKKNNNSNLLFAAKYEKKQLYLAITFSTNADEFAVIEDSNGVQIIGYPTYGYEFFGGYTFFKKLEVQAGFNGIHDINKDSAFKGKYKLLHYIFGLNYHFNKTVKLFCSARIAQDSELVSTLAADGVNVFSFGFSYTFNSKKW